MTSLPAPPAGDEPGAAVDDDAVVDDETDMDAEEEDEEEEEDGSPTDTEPAPLAVPCAGPPDMGWTGILCGP